MGWKFSWSWQKDMDAVTSEKLLIATPPYQNAWQCSQRSTCVHWMHTYWEFAEWAALKKSNIAIVRLSSGIICLPIQTFLPLSKTPTLFNLSTGGKISNKLKMLKASAIIQMKMSYKLCFILPFVRKKYKCFPFFGRLRKVFGRFLRLAQISTVWPLIATWSLWDVKAFNQPLATGPGFCFTKDGIPIFCISDVYSFEMLCIRRLQKNLTVAPWK